MGNFVCGNYRVTINQALAVDQQYPPPPQPDDLFATLASGSLFSTHDLSQLDLSQDLLLLDDSSNPFVTVNTHKGLYRYKRHLLGVASAPAIFQKLMDTILQGILSDFWGQDYLYRQKFNLITDHKPLTAI